MTAVDRLAVAPIAQPAEVETCGVVVLVGDDRRAALGVAVPLCLGVAPLGPAVLAVVLLDRTRRLGRLDVGPPGDPLEVLGEVGVTLERYEAPNA